MPLTSCPLTVPATAAYPVMVYPEQAEVHILEDEAASRAYIEQMWAEAMEIYRSAGSSWLSAPHAAVSQKNTSGIFMPEDTKARMIQAYLDKYTREHGLLQAAL